MVDVSSDGETEKRRWSASRIVSAVILLLIIFGGIAYGVYSLTQNNSTVPSNTNSSSSIGAATKGGSSSKNGTSKSKNSSSAKNSAKTPVASAPSSSNTNNNASGSANTSSGLSNTGPGDTALIGFIAAVSIGTMLHYGWRRFRAN